MVRSTSGAGREWVEIYEYDDGGPGSGFYAYCIAIRPPYKFADLVEWLKEREASATVNSKKGSRS